MARILELMKRIVSFVTTDVWRIRRHSLSRTHSFFVKQLRIVLLALRGFKEDKCHLRASALTFYSLLSIVPVFALAFGIAKGFGFEEIFKTELLEKVRIEESLEAQTGAADVLTQTDILNEMIGFAENALNNTKGGLVAGIGVVLLFWTIIKVFGSIEGSFNDIWGVKRSRTLARKFTDYLSMMLICPILFIFSSSMTVAVSGQFQRVIERVSLLGRLAPLVQFTADLVPYIIIWLLFVFIYMIMPNTRVRVRSALLAGIVAGTIYQAVQWLYIFFQVGVARYNAIYGSFAALPMFLIWLQMSWFILLFGAEISFAHQNVDTYEFELDCANASTRFKRLLSLRIVQMLSKRFCAGEPSWSANDIALKLETPVRLVRTTLFDLVETSILSEIKEVGDQDATYQPAQSTDNLTTDRVIKALDTLGSNNIPIAKCDAMKAIRESLDSFDKLIADSPANKPLKDI